MPRLAPQEVRTFFLTSSTAGKTAILQTDRMALLLINVLRDNREKKRFQLHEYVVMRNHIHLILTPAPEHPVEKCMQFIKGGFSFRAKKELSYQGEIWHPSYTQHRIEDARDYSTHRIYVHENPVRAGVVSAATDYPYSSANPQIELDPAPNHLQD